MCIALWGSTFSLGGRLFQIAVANSAVLWDLENKLNWSCLTAIVAHLLCIRLLGTNS